jgi:hypothetical protein
MFARILYPRTVCLRIAERAGELKSLIRLQVAGQVGRAQVFCVLGPFVL